MTALAELFPDEDFRFRLNLRREEPQAFFAPQDSTGRILAERSAWLRAAPATYAGLLPEGQPLWREFSALCASWGLGDPSSVDTLGATLEPDFLFLSPETAGGAFKLRGGALCFPTGWALQEKLGRPLEEIHGVVPGLNPALQSPIHQFLAKLKPGVAFQRANWGIAGSNELNLHPIRGLPGPEKAALNQLFLRVEHQVLIGLPDTKGVVFGIRIQLYPLDLIIANERLRTGLKRALMTMPAEVAAYKRLDAVQARLVALL